MATGSLYGSVSESTGLYGIGAASGGTYFEWFIFYDSATAPATPTGGLWSFTTNTGTAPSGWLNAPPASPTNLVWVSIAVVDSRSTSTLTWSTPGLMTGAGLPVLTGSGVPSSGAGLNGQLYINTATTPQSMYNKQSGSWVQITGSTLYATSGANTNITSLTGITGGISSATYVQLNTAGDGAVAAGKAQWDPTFGGPSIGMAGGNVNQIIGQDQFVYVYNNTGSTINKGEVVYISGSQGQRVTVALAQANADATSISVLGFAAESISNNSSGFIASVGLVPNINTSGFADGATLWLSPSVAGGYTTTKPVAPNHLVLLGYVVKGGSVGGGSIYVFTQNGYELDELHDVLITSVANGNYLRYNSAIPAWVNVAGPTGTLVGTTDTQTLTNKTISGSTNTLSNIGNSSLSNSTITINGSAISLGGSATIASSTPNNLVFGSGLSANANFNGSQQVNLTLANVGTAGTYGDSGTIPVITTNAFGQISSVSLQSVIVDSSDISGTIAIAQGGTGASSATNARINLLPSYTGNAGKLLAINATATDLEWRAVSGVGTVTSIDVSGGTTGLTTFGGPITAAGTITLAGTLNVANGGTGLTSLTAGYIPFGAGTSAFGSSANLFWDSANARLGVGTSSPSTRLHVASSGRDVAIIESTDAGALNGPYLNLYRNSASPAANDYLGFLQFTGKNSSGTTVDYAFIGTQATQVTTSPAQKGDLVFFTANEASPAERLRLTASGNLGLGVTPSAWVSSYKAIQVNQASLASYQSGADVNAVMILNAYADTAGSSKYLVTGAAAAQYSMNATGRHAWFIAPSGTAGNAISFTQAMTLDASGNLGVGTTSPAGVGGALGLHVNGPSGASTSVRITNGDTGSTATDGTAIFVGNAAGAGATSLNIYNYESSPIALYTGGTERVRIDSSGNLGLGVTPSAWGTASGRKAIEVGSTGNGLYGYSQSNFNMSAGAYFNGTNWIYTGTEKPSYYNQSVGAHSWYTAGTGTAGNAITFTQAMTLNASGNLGIGTSSPSTKLQVLSGTSVGAAFGSNQYIRLDGSSGASYTAAVANTGNTTSGYYFSTPINAYDGGFDYEGTSKFVTIRTNNAERARIDSSGNLGLGVTPSAFDSPWRALQITAGSGYNAPTVLACAYDSTYLLSNTVYTSGFKYIANNYATQYQQYQGAHKWYTAPSGTAGNAITFTQAMTLTAAGNLGLGTTSPTAITSYVANTINGASGSFTEYQQSGTNTFRIGTDSSSGGFLFTQAANPIRFGINGNESARIDSSGNLLVGKTASGNYTNGAQIYANGETIGLGHASTTGSGAAYLLFGYNNGGIGSITQSGTTAVLYNTTSDQRLKENIVDADSASTLIDALQVRKFDWKADGSHQRYGFVAQELVTVAPEAVHQPADPEEMMAVDYSKLVPMLVKEIQSLRARVAQLESN